MLKPSRSKTCPHLSSRNLKPSGRKLLKRLRNLLLYTEKSKNKWKTWKAYKSTKWKPLPAVKTLRLLKLLLPKKQFKTNKRNDNIYQQKLYRLSD
jgi:hypothetical protein